MSPRERKAQQRLIDGAAGQARKLRAAAKKEKNPARRQGFETAATHYQAIADAKRKELRKAQ